MRQDYNELVGLLVTHVKPASQYRIDYVYARTVNGKYQGSLIMKGYDMALYQPFGMIVRRLQEVYAPAIKSIWQHDNLRWHRWYLQFVTEVHPDSIGLGMPWKHWAQW